MVNDREVMSMMQGRSRRGIAGLLQALLAGPGLLALGGGVRAAEDPFDWQEIPTRGRAVAADLTDLDGDGRTDLLEVAFVGLPPAEEREIRIRLQREDGSLPDAPDHVFALPAGAAAYDLARLPDRAGEQMLLLGSEGLSVLALEGARLARRELRVEGTRTLGSVPADRHLERLPLVWNGPEGGPLLRVPLFGELVLLTASGETRARLDVGGRADYFVPARLGPLLTESGVEVYFDWPRVTPGDADGDGRLDLIAATRREIRLFRQRPGGGFTPAPDRILTLAPASEQEHVSGSGQVRVGVADLDGDGRADLLLSRTSGGFAEAEARVSVHLNRNGSWDLEAADHVLVGAKGWAGDQLADLDGDGVVDLVHVRVALSLLELVEALLTRALDLEIRVHRGRPGGFEAEPWVRRKLGLPISFETFRTRGFLPTFAADLNGDGYPDLLTSDGGESLEVRLGGPHYRFESRQARQAADTRGRLGIGDLDRDGLPDLLLWEPSLRDVPLRLARNRGLLPGEP
jgi:hypothetical protein